MYSYKEHFTTPSSLQNFLNEEMKLNKNIKDSTDIMKKVYANILSTEEMGKAGSSVETSGSSGNASGGSGNSSSSEQSSSGSSPASSGEVMDHHQIKLMDILNKKKLIVGALGLIIAVVEIGLIINAYLTMKYKVEMSENISKMLSSIYAIIGTLSTIIVFNLVALIIKRSITKDAAVHSYACRTGNNQNDVMQDDFTSYYTIHYFARKADFTERHLTKESAQKRYIELKKGFSVVYLYEPSTFPSDIHSEQSLAQKLANYLGISVFAFKTRSDYQPTWHGNFKKIEIDDETVEKGGFLGYKVWQDGDHALWNSTGAINGVKGGDTPKGLDNKLTEFKPH